MDLVQEPPSWAARVAGAGMLTPEQAARWQAERDRITVGMVDRVQQVGQQVSGRIHAYEAVLRRAVGVFADQGFVTADELDRPAPPAPVGEGGVQHRISRQRHWCTAGGR